MVESLKGAAQQAGRAPPSLEVNLLDLASLDSVRSFVQRWEQQQRPLHILINNAGMFNMGGELTGCVVLPSMCWPWGCATVANATHAACRGPGAYTSTCSSSGTDDSLCRGSISCSISYKHIGGAAFAYQAANARP